MFTTSLSQLNKDIIETATLAAVPVDRYRIERTTSVFAESFRCSPIGFRTSEQASGMSGLSYRFAQLDASIDVLNVALGTGLLSTQGRPIDRLPQQLSDRFALQGWGVEAEVSYGVEKMWQFFAHAYPIEEARAVGALPAGVAAAVPFLRKHGLSHFSTVVTDYRREATTLYFAVSASSPLSVQRLHLMLNQLGLTEPRALVAYAANAGLLAITFGYRSPQIERVSACVAVPGPAGQTNVDTSLRRLIANAPIRAEQRAFIMGPTFTVQGAYTDLEIDYTGSMLSTWTRCSELQQLPVQAAVA